jgi:hypothetical protein
VISGSKGLERLDIAIEFDLCRDIGYAYVCKEFEMLEVTVPNIFLGTVGFSPCRDGRKHSLLQQRIWTDVPGTIVLPNWTRTRRTGCNGLLKFCHFLRLAFDSCSNFTPIS